MTRIPFVAAVVGALLIGGAATGGTHASWVKSAQLAQTVVKSGSMGYTATNPAGVTVNKVVGSTTDTSITVHDTSVGKNLKQRISASIAGQPAGLTATVGTSCGSGNTFVDSSPGAANQTFCVRVTVSNATDASNGNVTVNLSSAQRPSAGWTTPTITRSVAVTVLSAVPSAPSLSCSPGRQNNNDFKFSWSSVNGATNYNVYVAGTNSDASYGVIAGMPTTNTDLTVSGLTNGVARYYRVKVTTPGGTSAYSNTIKVTRTSNGSDNFECVGVTP